MAMASNASVEEGIKSLGGWSRCLAKKAVRQCE
jgi:hypothetical protein